MLMIYILLVIVRILATVQRGYIHPDEFFQGGQELFFGCHHDVHQHYSTNVDQELFHDNKDTMNTGTDGGGGDVRVIDGSRQTKVIKLNANLHGLLDGINHIVATWEFQQPHALRSILPPLLMTVLPLRMYAFTKQQWRQYLHHRCWSDALSGWEILVIPRTFMVILSILTLDLPIWYMAKYMNFQNRTRAHPPGRGDFIQSIFAMRVPVEVFVFATSWVTLVFLNRPFTNTLETMVLSILCFLTVHDNHNIHKNRNLHQGLQERIYSFQSLVLIPFAVGITGAIGIFTRFTFAIFAFPVVLTILHQRYACHDNNNLNAALKHVTWTIVMIGIAFLSTSACFIYSDTIFYSSQQQQQQQPQEQSGNALLPPRHLVVSPWNAFRYNSRTENLSDHGLHPRITHAIVNLPMLFGPLACFFYCDCIMKKWRWRQTEEKETTNENASTTKTMMIGILVMGLGVLSLAPHQEPRFLLPMTISLTLLYAKHLVHVNDENAMTMNYWTTFVWGIFNVLLWVFFGGTHQAGVIPSLLALPTIHGPEIAVSDAFASTSSSTISSTGIPFSQRKYPLAAVYYHTYMPPTFLMRQNLVFDAQQCSSKEQRQPLGHRNGDDNDSPQYVEGKYNSCTVEHDDSNDPLMPPSLCHSAPVIELQSHADPTTLFDTLQHIMPCSESGKDAEWLYLIMPRTCMDITMVMEDITKDSTSSLSPSDECHHEHNSSLFHRNTSPSTSSGTIWKDYRWEEIWVSSFQIATEDMPQVLSRDEVGMIILSLFRDSRLVMYQIRCTLSPQPSPSPPHLDSSSTLPNDSDKK